MCELTSRMEEMIFAVMHDEGEEKMSPNMNALLEHLESMLPRRSSLNTHSMKLLWQTLQALLLRKVIYSSS